MVISVPFMSEICRGPLVIQEATIAVGGGAAMEALLIADVLHGNARGCCTEAVAQAEIGRAMRTRSPVRVAMTLQVVPQWQKRSPRVADSGSSSTSTVGSSPLSKITTRGRPPWMPVPFRPDREDGSR